MSLSIVPSRAGARQCIEVRAFSRLSELARWREALSALAGVSRRRSPFLTPAYLEAFEAHDEFARPGSQTLLLLAFEGERPIGFLPLRLVVERVLGAQRHKLELFTTHDMDRPTLVAHPRDEAACAAAFIEHLATVQHGWSFLELIEQEAGAPLAVAAGALAQRGFYVRRYPNNPYSTVSLERGFDAWFRELGKDERSRVARRTRALVQRGEVELWASAGRGAAQPMLDLYLDLERRSWKEQAHAGIGRHPVRVDLFRAMLSAPQQMVPLFHWLLLDGLPIAGALSLEYEDTQFLMESAYDEAFKPFAPGNLLFVLAMHDAAERGIREVDLLGNFAYHKQHWVTQVSETFAVQAYRPFSLHHLKARAGELKRRLGAEGLAQRDATYNLSKPAEALPIEADRQVSKAMAANVRAELVAHGTDPVMLAGRSLLEVLPFDAARRKSA